MYLEKFILVLSRTNLPLNEKKENIRLFAYQNRITQETPYV